MTVRTFLLSCFFHILLFIGLAIPEIARADLDKAIAYAEAGEKDKAHKELLLIAETAQTGHPKALFEFGVMYKTEGLWIVHSDESAFENWLASAELGYAPAQFAVGSAYIIGSGIEKDLSEAKRWLQFAIDNTYELYSRVALTLYNANELDKY
jgi:TPR repeat protein